MRKSSMVKRTLIATPVLAVMAAGLAWGDTSAKPANTPARYTPTDRDYYINYVEPKVERTHRRPGGPQGARGKRNVKQARPDPVRPTAASSPRATRSPAEVLAKTEAEAIRTGKNPRDIRYKQADETQVAKLLTILVEFNPNANDDFSGVMVPQATFDDADHAAERA